MAMDMEKILKELQEADLEAYGKIARYCQSFDGATLGVPAIIGLDDLTDRSCPVYEGAAMDAQMNEKMAADALIFTWVCSQLPDRNPNYPDIAPAMTAVAEKNFLIKEGETEPTAYHKMVQWEE